MRRRKFITLLGSTAAWPVVAHAQQTTRLRRVGVLMARRSDDPEGQKQLAALRAGLEELGWLDGHTIHFEDRWIVGDPIEALEYARELASDSPDVLVANGTPSLAALRQVTRSIPIVFATVVDPVGQGFVQSLSQPGGNITGFSVEEVTMGGKWLEILKEAAPRVARVAALYNPDTAPYATLFLPPMQAAASHHGVTLAVQPVHSLSEIEKITADTGREPNGGLMVLTDTFMFGRRPGIIALAAEHHLPAIYPIRAFAVEGGLIAYSIDRIDPFHRAAAYVDRILHGTQPASLPVQQPTKFDLVINLKTAKTLGITVPSALIARADEVIE